MTDMQLVVDQLARIEKLDARIEALEAALLATQRPLAELVIAYQDADSPAIQDTLRRARAALAEGQDK